MKGFSDLEEVLEALVAQGDWDAEDGVGGVLIETRLTVSSEQTDSPAPSDKEHFISSHLIQTDSLVMNSQKTESQTHFFLSKDNTLPAPSWPISQEM